MPKNKFYTVWIGKQPGIYTGWDQCKEQVEGYPGARYKGFPTRELAESAFGDDPEKYLSRELTAPKTIITGNPLAGSPDPDSICVDAACSGNPGVLEYRGVDTRSGGQLFRQGPFPEGTVNIGEFLAIVHALAYLKQRDMSWPVYSDSRTAIAWIRRKKANTKLEQTEKNQKLFLLIRRAEEWLRHNTWPNRILKWETEYWGEIPADFGRK
jgi:ribonuclease HI